MKKAVKIGLITAAVLIVAGILTVGAVFAIGGGFAQQSPYTSVTHRAESPFDSISVSVAFPEVRIELSPDGTAYAVCDEGERIHYTLTVEEETLYLREHDDRRWVDHIGILYAARPLMLYLPEGIYNSLTVETVSSSLKCEASELSFYTVDLTSSSGSIRFSTPVLSALYAESTSGGIHVANASPENVFLNSTSGNISAENVQARAGFEAVATSGSVTVKNCNAKRIMLKSTSGSIKLTKSAPVNIDLHTTSGSMRLDGVVASGTLSAKSASGSIKLEGCDAGNLQLESTSGSIGGTLLSDKWFDTRSTSGSIRCPASVKDAGKCTVVTVSGSIKFEIAE